MAAMKDSVLTINGGSSSIKFALYKDEEPLALLFYGQIDGIGTKNIMLSFTNTLTKQKYSVRVQIQGHNEVAKFLVDLLGKQVGFDSIKAIGHRIVHGMKRTEPVEITAELLNEFTDISSYDPEHLPAEIRLIELFRKRYPKLLQIACFDTSFHASMPQVAKLLSIPRQYYKKGIQRYGFHGLSYSYLMEELKREAGNKTAKGKIILAHLGSGASIAAVKDGKSVDTSMGFTPTSGLPMGTRTGDMDPGVALYLMRTEHLNQIQFNKLINHDSGLLGISETSSDMRDLLDSQYTDNRAADAVDFFCYQTRKWIGSFAAVLEGVDTLIFTGGIGEHSSEIRQRICQGLQFLGIELDKKGNEKNDKIISIKEGRVCVRVMNTNEQLMIAKLVCQFLNHSVKY